MAGLIYPFSQSKSAPLVAELVVSDASVCTSLTEIGFGDCGVVILDS